MEFQVTPASIKNMPIEQISMLINQLEEAMMSNLSIEQKSKLNILLGKCIDIYISKK